MFCCLVIRSKIRVYLFETLLLPHHSLFPSHRTRCIMHKPSFPTIRVYICLHIKEKVSLFYWINFGCHLQADVIDIPLDINSCTNYVVHGLFKCSEKRSKGLRPSISCTVFYFQFMGRKKYLHPNLPVWVIDPGRHGCPPRGIRNPFVLLMVSLEAPPAPPAWFMCRVAESSMRISIAHSWRTCITVQIDTWSCPPRACFFPVFLPGSHKTA